MLVGHTIFDFGVDVSVCWATHAFLFFDVEDGVGFGAGDALLAIEEGMVVGTVGDVVVSDAPLVVLLDEVVDGHVAQDPAVGVDVGLEDGGPESNCALALGVHDGFDAVEEEDLFFDVRLYLADFLRIGQALTELLELLDLLFGVGELLEDVDFLFVGHLFATGFG